MINLGFAFLRVSENVFHRSPNAYSKNKKKNNWFAVVHYYCYIFPFLANFCVIQFICCCIGTTLVFEPENDDGVFFKVTLHESF